MGALERVFGAVQDGDQVDHCVVPVHQPHELHGVVHVGLDHGHAGQVLNSGRLDGAARGHRDAPTLAVQLFANVAADKTGTTQNEDVFHGIREGLC